MADYKNDADKFIESYKAWLKMKEQESMGYGIQSDIIANFGVEEVEEALVDLAVNRWAPGGWEAFRTSTVGTSIAVEGLGEVRLLANTYNYDGYESSPQGGTKAYMVVQVGNKFFKKPFDIDSYGDVNYNAGVTRVQGRTKTITVFDDDEV